MPDLKYNTSDLRDSAAKYRDIADEMKSVKTDLKKQISDLKDVYWKSEAGEEFMNLYEDSWATNVDKYVAVLREMASILEKAANDYDDVTSKIKTIPEIEI